MGFTGIILDKGTVVSCERAQKITLWDGSEGYGMVIRIRCNSHNPQNSQKNSSKKDSDKSQTSKDSKRDQIITSSTYIGESIAVDGVCLTVTDFDNSKGEFEVNIAEHTTSITTYGKEFRPDFGEGSQVNLEPAYDGSVGISGHNVQGHVDCVGKILKMEREKDMLKVEFELKKEMRGLIVKKGKNFVIEVGDERIDS